MICYIIVRLLFPFAIFFLLLFFFTLPIKAETRFFPVQSIDTMKTSRDRAREKLSSERINTIIKNIADVGATHVAIGTPYEEEFVPVMKQWVDAARRYKLHVWFRGNTAGWEEWFDYPRIDRRIHTLKVGDFITSNPELFEDGDIFVSCPECENGGPGDPRETGDIQGFRTFLINERKVADESFAQIGKKVTTSYYSMNGDVARLIMDEPTTKALGGVVTIDHYVKDSDGFIKDIGEYAQKSGGDVVLGEWGAPIPDIHGEMTSIEQADYIHETMQKLVLLKEVKGINYWTASESSTALWDDSGKPRAALSALKTYFSPSTLSLKVVNIADKSLARFDITTPYNTYSNVDSTMVFPYLPGDVITVRSKGYENKVIHLKQQKDKHYLATVVLKRERSGGLDELFDRVDKLFRIFSVFERI